MELVKSAGYVTTLLLIGLFLMRWGSTKASSKELLPRLVMATIAVQAGAFLMPNLGMYLALIVVIIPLLASRADMILPIYIFVYLTLPDISSPLSVGGLYLLSSSATLMANIGALVAMLVRRRGGASSSGLFHDWPALLLFVLITFVGARGTTFTNLLRVALDTGFNLFIPYFVVSRQLRGKPDLDQIAYAFISAVLSLSVLAVYEALHAWPLYRLVWDHFGVPLTSGASVKLRGGLLRSPGPYPEPISFSFVLAIGFLFAIVTRSLFRSPMHRLCLLLVMGAGVSAPQARGAWLGLAAGLLGADYFQRRYGVLTRKIAILLFAGVAVFASAEFSPTIANIVGLHGEGAGSIDYRENLLSRGLEEVREHPLSGMDFDSLQRDLNDLRQGEGIIDFVNTYLFFALLSGLSGLAVLASILIYWWTSALSLRRRLAGDDDLLRIGAFCFSSMSAILIMIAFTSMSSRSWGALMIVAATISSSRRLRRLA